MKQPLHRSAFLLVAALLLASCSVERVTSREVVVKGISSTLSERTGVPVEVTCPELVPGKTNQCQARAQTGETFTVEVTKGAGDDWGWTTTDIAFGPAVAERLAPVVMERAGVPVAITCPAFPLGKTCEARAQTGETFAIAVKQGMDQTFDWEAKGATFGKAVADRINQVYAANGQAPLPGLTCTGIILEGRAEPATCQTQVQGVTVVFDVKAEADGVSFTARRGFVDFEAATKLVVDQLSKLGLEAKVDCGSVPRVAIPNSKFQCTARDASGDTLPVYYRVTSNGSGLEMQGTPFP